MGKPTQEQFEKIEQTIAGVNELMEGGNGGELSEFEESFMISMDERVTQYGSDTFVSPKQMAIIDKIYEKIVGQ